MKRKAFSLTFILVMAFFIGLAADSFPVVRVVKANPYTTPECAVLSPKNSTAYNTAIVDFCFVVYDGWIYYYSFDKRIKMKQVKVEEISQKLAESGETMLQFSTELHDLSDGKHNLTIYCKDVVEFFFPRPIQLYATITFYVDTLAPTITNLSVNATTSSDRLLNFTVDKETGWIGYSLDNQANVTVNSDIFLKGLAVGSHNVTVYAEDVAGNIGASETLFFTVEEPFPTLLLVTASVTIAVVCIGLCLLVYLIKRK